jgi:hypothetical protein
MDHAQPQTNGFANGDEGLRKLRNATEALNNLIYLASQEAENAERVRFYMKLAGERVAIMAALMRSSPIE